MKSQAQLMQLIEQEIHNLKPDAPAITADTDLTAELGLDSVQVLEMITELEDHLDLSIPINRLGDVHTAGELSQLLVKLQQESA
ncbi:MAG: acyl carrier protein [Wenzhouxiangellaceae bacterium]